MPDAPHEPDEEELERRLRRILGEAEAADSDHLDEIELKLRDVEAQYEKEREARHSSEGLFDDEFEDRLRALHDKAEKAKTIRNAETQTRLRQQKATGEDARGLGVGLTIAYTIIGFPLFGALVGWLIDGQRGSTNIRGIGMLVGAVLGVAAAAMLMSRTNKNS